MQELSRRIGKAQLHWLLKKFSAKFVSNSRVFSSAHPDVASTSREIQNVSLDSIKKKRSELFGQEKSRQIRNIQPINKIEVGISGPPDELKCTLAMNAGVSTPYDCAKHLNESVMKFAALATVNGKQWDMQKPIVSPDAALMPSSVSLDADKNSVDLKFLYFTDQKPWLVHSAYWRSCSLILGAILESCFKDEIKVTLHSWPGTNYRTGSFVYDCRIDGITGWIPKEEELNIMGRTLLGKIKEAASPFEPLEVDIAVAEKIFEDNPFKLEQMERIGRQSKPKGRIPLYRLGDFVDISRGPMISTSSQIGNYAVTKIFPFESQDWGQLYRVQGVSLPFTQRVNSWTWEVLTNAAKRENKMPFPSREHWAQREEIRRKRITQEKTRSQQKKDESLV